MKLRKLKKAWKSLKRLLSGVSKKLGNVHKSLKRLFDSVLKKLRIIPESLKKLVNIRSVLECYPGLDTQDKKDFGYDGD